MTRHLAKDHIRSMSTIRWLPVALAWCVLSAQPGSASAWVVARWPVGGVVRDYGIGIATFSPPGRVPADTMVVHAAPSPSSATMAYLIQRGDGSAWEYLLSSPDSLGTHFIEYGGEQAGVPIDSLGAAGTWARLAYATSPRGSVSLGWIHLVGGDHRALLWADQMSTHALFFQPDASPKFYGRPDGMSLPARLESGSHDYIMYCIRIQGAWMLVKEVKSRGV